MSTVITELHPGSKVLSIEGGETINRVPLIVLGMSKSNDSVVLLSNKVLNRMQMRPRFGIGDYFHSAIDDYLETVFMDFIPYSLKQTLVKTWIYAETSTEGITAVRHKRRRVFLPSMNELGFGTMPMEGIDYINALKAYFHTSSESIARFAAERGVYETRCYWTRSSPRSGMFYCVTSGGDGIVNEQYTRNVWIRPCFSVSVDTEVMPLTELTGRDCYALIGIETKRVIQEDLFMRLMTL